MSIATFRLAREQEEAKLNAETEVAAEVAETPAEEAPVACPAPAPKAPVASAKTKTTTVKG
jgi:hypothetical protein